MMFVLVVDDSNLWSIPVLNHQLALEILMLDFGKCILFNLSRPSDTVVQDPY